MIRGNLQERAIRYLSKMEPSVSGQNGHGKLFAAAVALVQGFGMEPEQAAEVLLEYFNPRCSPAWTYNEILHKTESALKDFDGRKERGYLLSGTGTSFIDNTPLPPIKKPVRQEPPKRITRFYREDRADGACWLMHKETVFPNGRTVWEEFIWNGFRYEVKGGATGNVVENWVHLYDDGDGAPYMLVHRLKFADGRKMTPLFHYEQSEGRYLAGAGGLPKIPYNAQKVKEAQFIRICEGEKNADSVSAYLQEEGLLDVDSAVTTSGGSHTFNSSMADWFIGKDVLIYRDKDRTGEEAARNIAEELRGKARSIQIIDDWADWLPEGADITDWIEINKEGWNDKRTR